MQRIGKFLYSIEAKMLRESDTDSVEKHIKCQTCGQGFADAISLSRHKRIHTGGRQHKCDNCVRNFPSRMSLKYICVVMLVRNHMHVMLAQQSLGIRSLL